MKIKFNLQSKIFLFLILVIANLMLVSAYGFSTSIDKSFDKSNLKYGKITLIDNNILTSDKKLTEVTLTDNTDYCGENCYADLTTTLYSKGKLLDSIKFLRGNIKDYSVLIQDGEKEIDKEIYENVCDVLTTYANGSQEKNCYNKIVGYEKVNVPNYVKYNNEELKAGTYNWRIEGTKNPTDTIDWIVTSNGKELTEWALWSGVSTGGFIDDFVRANGNIGTNYTFVASDAICNQEIFSNMVYSNSLTASEECQMNQSNQGASTYNFNKTYGTFEMKFRAYNYSSFNFKIRDDADTAIVSFKLNSTNIKITTGYEGAGNMIVLAGNPNVTLTPQTWYTVKLVINTSRNYTQLYVDGLNIANTTLYTNFSANGLVLFPEFTAPTLPNGNMTIDYWEWGNSTGELSPASVTLNFPADNSQTINPSVLFNCSVNGTNLINLSLILNGTIDTTITNTSGSQENISLETTKVLPYGDTNWTCNATDYSNIVSTATTRNVSVRTLVENSQTFNTITTSGANELFILNISYNNLTFTTSQAYFVYNNTRYLGTKTDYKNNTLFEKSITILGVTDKINKTFYWEIQLYNGTWNYFNSTFNNQTINPLEVGNCSTYGVVAYNFTSYDEETKTKLSNTTIEIQLNLYDVSRTVKILNYSQSYSVNPALICFNNSLLTTINYSADLVVRYYANDTVNNKTYAIEYYNILNQLLSNQTVPNVISLYDLNKDDATEFQLTFRDSYSLLAPDVLVYLYRQYIADNDFKIVEIPLTDSNGQAVLNMVRNNVIYNIVFINSSGDVIATFNKITAFCQDYTIGSCTINLNAPPETADNIYDYTDDLGISYTQPVYSNSTGLVTFDFVSNNLSSVTVSMEVIRNNQFGNRSVCTNSLTSQTGTLSCNVSSISSTDRFLFVNIFVNGELKVMSTIDLEANEFNFGIVNGAFYALLFMLFIITMFMGDKQTLVFSLVIGWVVVISFGLVNGRLFGSQTITAGGIWIVICGVIYWWKLSKEEA